MSVTVTLHPDHGNPPDAKSKDFEALHAVVTIVPNVDILFGPNDEWTVPYLREWAATLTALADELATETDAPLMLDGLKP